jgi:hypothetical protein
MSPFYIGLAAGLFIGAFMGVFVLGLCRIARDADDRAEKILREETGWNQPSV